MLSRMIGSLVGIGLLIVMAEQLDKILPTSWTWAGVAGLGIIFVMLIMKVSK